MCGGEEESGRCLSFLEEKDFLLDLDPEGIEKDLEGGISFLLSGGASVPHLISGTRTEVSSVCPDPSEKLSTQILCRLHCQVCPGCGWNTQPGSACGSGWGSRRSQQKASRALTSLGCVLQEVVLWRKGDIVRKSMSHQAAIASQRFEGTSSHGEAKPPGQPAENNGQQ